MTETAKLVLSVFKLRIGVAIMLCALAGVAITPAALPEDLVAGPEAGDLAADRFDRAGQGEPQDRALRSEQPLIEPHREPRGRQQVPVARPRGGRAGCRRANSDSSRAFRPPP